MWALVIAAAAQSEIQNCSNFQSNFQSFWVTWTQEEGQLNSPDRALSVPTAAGNLITHLAANRNEINPPYPYNYGLDIYAENINDPNPNLGFTNFQGTRGLVE